MYNLIDFRQYFIDKYYKQEWINSAKLNFANAEPFPHIVIDNFLPEEVMDAVLESYDSYDSSQWFQFQNENELKLASRQEIMIPQLVRNILQELNSGYVLDWLEHLTGVPGIVADTRLYGGGMHKIQSGGKLAIHQDFNVENRTRLYRQLNLLLYLNKDWKEEYGGHLELWNRDKTECVFKVAPIFNRCIIFNTNTGYSWHGHPHPLNTPKEISRKSLALYYYNVGEEAAILASMHARSTVFKS
jgi:Rps23 Pro-64 3,4-dihydroxylase Tpa1-like proline 4-hydroxylase